MSYPGTNQSRLAYLEPTHAMNERSAFIYAVEYCNHFMPEPAEIKALTPQPWSMRVPIFHVGSDGGALLGQALGIDSKTWTRALGRDIVGIHSAKAVLFGELRYCANCLAQGWHSALFQHAAVAQCPLHRTMLRTGCPHCGASITTSMSAIGKNHLHCAECNRGLAGLRRRLGLGMPIVQMGCTTFQPLRASLQDTGASDMIRSPLELVATPVETLRTLSETRNLAHHLQWPDPGVELGGACPRQRDTFLSTACDGAELSLAQLHKRLRIVSLSTLDDLLQTVQQAGVSIEIPSQVSAIGRSAARVDAAMGLVAAALWRTAHIFEVSRFLLGELPPPQATEQPLSAGIPAVAGIDEAVRQSQVVGVFVSSLLMLRHCRYGVQVDWNVPGAVSALQPAWRGTVFGGRVELRLRSRCDMRLVARLAKRYATRRLESAPEGSRPEEIACAGDSALPQQ